MQAADVRAAVVARQRPLFFALLSLIVLAVAAWEAVALWHIIGSEQAIGVDLVFYRDMGQRWLETGTFYGERQLTGPYETTTLVDNLYPPHALYLFVPFVFLPAILWWAIPFVVVVYTILRLRPKPWAWPLLALVVALPKTIAATIFGNSDLWVTAAVAGGVLWGWPATLASFKPSLALFALVGVRRRDWWIGVAVLGLASLPFLTLWLQYPTVMLNTNSNLTYSLSNVPMILLPVIAWVAASRRPPLGGRSSTVATAMKLHAQQWRRSLLP